MDPIEALRIRGIGVGKKLVGDAQAGDVRAGKTFSNAQGNSNTGTLPVRSTVAQTVTPGVNNITKQAGIYDGDVTVQGDANLAAQNIKQGITMFGVVGTYSEKKFASGTSAIATDNTLAVTGLEFTPSVVIVDWFAGDSYYRKTYRNNTVRDTIIYYTIVGNTSSAAGTATSTPKGWTVGSGSFNTGKLDISSLGFSGKIASWIAYE